MNYKHYIITRFNNNLYRRPDADVWMSRRMAIFEKYYLPGLRSQTSKNFTWIMSVDTKTPANIIDYFKLLGAKLIYDRPRDKGIKNIVPDHDAEWIVTSRIDNDDAYFPTFVESIQRELTPMKRVIDIEYCIWDHRVGELWDYNRPAANSPFITLVERWDEAEGVYAHEHSSAPERYTAWRIPGNILACQIIHGHNVLNKVLGKKTNYKLDASDKGIRIEKKRN